MLRIRKIFHPTDFSPCADAAFVHALHLARRYGAALHVAHVAPSLFEHHLRDVLKAVLDEEAFEARQREEEQRRLHTLVTTYQAGDVPLVWASLRGLAPAAVLLDYAEAEDVDLVVMGTHGQRGVRRLLLGSVAEEVVRRASCPVLTVRAPETAPDVAVLTLRRLLVPIDFSPHALSALRYAVALAAPDQAHLDLLHVVDPVQRPAFYETGLRARRDLEAELEAEALRHLEEIYAEIENPAADVAFHARTGYPPQQIVAFAEETAADLVVIATHGLRGLERFPMGSVAERVVRGAPCPVFVTRPFGKSLLRTGVVEAAAHTTGAAVLPGG